MKQYIKGKEPDSDHGVHASMFDTSSYPSPMPAWILRAEEKSQTEAISIFPSDGYLGHFADRGANGLHYIVHHPDVENLQLAYRVAKQEHIMIVRDKLGGDCIQIRSTDCSNDNAGGRTFIVYFFTQLWKWKEGCRKELPLREDDAPGVVDQEVLEMDADHDCIFTMLQFPDRDYEGYSVNRTTDGWYFLISHKDVQYRMTIAHRYAGDEKCTISTSADGLPTLTTKSDDGMVNIRNIKDIFHELTKQHLLSCERCLQKASGKSKPNLT